MIPAALFLLGGIVAMRQGWSPLVGLAVGLAVWGLVFLALQRLGVMSI